MSGETATFEIRYVNPDRDSLDPADFASVFSEGVVETVEDLDAAVASPAPDCFLIPVESAAPTPRELVDAVDGSRFAPPVVLLVEPEDDTVPVTALDDAFAGAIVIRDPATAPATVRTRLLELLPDRDRPRLARIGPTDERTLNDWKASVLDQFFGKIPLHMYVKDTEAYNVMVSDALVRRRLHEGSEKYLGKRDIDGVVPIEEGTDPYRDDLRVLDDGDAIHLKPEHYPTTDRTFLTSKAPLTDESDEIVGLIGIAEEITDQRQRERQLEAVNHIVRHTMRNDLNAIAGWVEMLETDHQADASIIARVSRIANGLCEKIDKQQHIVDILSEESHPDAVDLSRMVNRKLDELASKHAHATIDRDVAPDVRALVVPRFDSAIEELVDNAVTHCTDATPVIDVRLRTEAETAVFQISDQCDPIPECERRILTRGEKIDKLTHNSGLGLWMVRWIAESCDGTIDFENTGVGNRITITVPLAPSA